MYNTDRFHKQYYTDRHHKPKVIDWKNKTMVYDMLSQYYVRQRSVIFIVDSVFGNQWYQDKANKIVYEQFMNLTQDDYFGFIKLSKNLDQDWLYLETKEKNRKLKEFYF